jgi:hypothetical protein
VRRIDHRTTRRLAGVLVTACLMSLIAATRARADEAPFTIVPQAPMVSTPPGSDEQGRTDQTSVTFQVKGTQVAHVGTTPGTGRAQSPANEGNPCT